MRIELRRAKRGLAHRNQFYFAVIADNGETVATSETYANKGDARDTIALLRSEIRSADYADLTDDV